jgi:histidine triad (HIT) family protein
MEDCIFCRIAKGEMDADMVYADDEVIAFRDINAVAPSHVLVVTRKHIPSVLELTPQDAPLLGRIFQAIQAVGESEGTSASGMRILTNVGREAGQIVMHLHFHVLGGRGMDWPPG